MQVMPFADILFGNDSEAELFVASIARNDDLKGDIMKQVEYIAHLEKKNPRNSRIVVITRGHLPTVVYHEERVIEIPVTIVESSLIIDTNGAGDVFVGGFLSKLIQHRSIIECVEFGHQMASEIIKRSGVFFPAKFQ